MSTRKSVLAALLTSAALAACAPAAAPPPDVAAVRTAIGEVNAKFVAAVEKGDTAAAVAKLRRGRDGIAAGWTDLARLGGDHAGLRRHARRLHGQGLHADLGRCRRRRRLRHRDGQLQDDDGAQGAPRWKTSASMSSSGRNRRTGRGSCTAISGIRTLRRSRERREPRRCQLTAITRQPSDQGPRFRFAHRPVKRPLVW